MTRLMMMMRLMLAGALLMVLSASGTSAAGESSWAGVKLLMTSDSGPQAAAKNGGPPKEDEGSVSQTEEPNVVTTLVLPGADGELKVRRKLLDKTSRNDLKVVLGVSAGAVTEPVEITMKVDGYRQKASHHQGWHDNRHPRPDPRLFALLAG